MKKILLLLVITCSPLLSISQTFPFHEVDDCKVLTGGFEQNSEYIANVNNPDSNDSSINVSNIAYFDNPAQGANVSSVFFLLPESIQAGSVIDWSGRFYSDNTGSAGTGSGQFRIQLLNNELGASITASLGNFDKVGGSWQTESGTNVTLSTSDDAAINNAGGFDVIRIFNTTDTSINPEDLFFDNLELSVNFFPNLDNENATLLPNNQWVYNNRPGDTQNEATNDFNVTPTYGVATPSTDGNSASEVIQINVESGFSAHRFPLSNAIDPPFNGSVLVRVYLETCNIPYVNNLRIGLRKDNDATTAYTATSFKQVPANMWTELSFDLSELNAPESPTTQYNQLDFIYDQGDGGAATGSIYYLDAIQAQNGTLSNDFFNKENIKVFMSSRNNLRIIGLDPGDVDLRLFNLTGKAVMTTSFSTQTTNNILVDDLSTGVYIVELSTQYGKINKKIFVK